MPATGSPIGLLLSLTYTTASAPPPVISSGEAAASPGVGRGAWTARKWRKTRLEQIAELQDLANEVRQKISEPVPDHEGEARRSRMDERLILMSRIRNDMSQREINARLQMLIDTIHEIDDEDAAFLLLN